MYNLQFLAGESVNYTDDRLHAMNPNYNSGVNYLISLGSELYAECPVPDGAAEDYGYMALKSAIVTMAGKHGISADQLSFWYDGQEQYLSEEARAACPVYVRISATVNGEDVFDEAEL